MSSKTIKITSHIENPKSEYLKDLLYESNLIEGVNEEKSCHLSIRCFKEAALEFDSDGLKKIDLLIEGSIEDEYENGLESYFHMNASQVNPSDLKNFCRILISRGVHLSEYYDELSHLFSAQVLVTSGVKVIS